MSKKYNYPFEVVHIALLQSIFDEVSAIYARLSDIDEDSYLLKTEKKFLSNLARLAPEYNGKKDTFHMPPILPPNTAIEPAPPLTEKETNELNKLFDNLLE